MWREIPIEAILVQPLFVAATNRLVSIKNLVFSSGKQRTSINYKGTKSTKEHLVLTGHPQE